MRIYNVGWKPRKRQKQLRRKLRPSRSPPLERKPRMRSTVMQHYATSEPYTISEERVRLRDKEGDVEKSNGGITPQATDNHSGGNEDGRPPKRQKKADVYMVVVVIALGSANIDDVVDKVCCLDGPLHNRTNMQYTQLYAQRERKKARESRSNQGIR
uniref:Uncharacterized protein n=1 Tax=Steinernema glaseri TaxID=37863 RepID=A0A1I8AJI7_9BILA